jgi:GMP synthase (glutamine-hydrolysing)
LSSPPPKPSPIKGEGNFVGIGLSEFMTVLIIKHVEIEGPGLIEDCLKEEKIPYQILNLESGVHLPKPDDCAGIVILGGPMNVYEEDRYPFLREEDLFIKEAIQRGKAVLGICLGAQLIAKALGAKVTKALVKEIGWFDVSLTGAGLHDPLFSRLPETFSVFQWHEDTFHIPSAGRLIATSNPVPHQAFRYGENAYGLQFHLEVTEEMIREWMKTYEDEFSGSQAPLLPKLRILCETERKIGAYKKRGIRVFKNFFRQTFNH